MEAELTALAASGATAFVGLMVTEAWTQARGRVARFLARGEDVDVIDGELEESREELAAARAAADDEAVADVEEEWRIRLRRALRANPEAADELRALIEELSPLGSAGPTVSVTNSISGGTQNGPVFQGQTFSALTFNSGRSADAPEQRPGTA
ncbi:MULTISPECIES: hypothetical protein [Streptomyces]|uniref:hypothetical protein n=1 Tax=Streptomyces TaxID=1883 RepID=UPI0002EBA13B|nr:MULTISPECIES: hypothetical protein [Streptomyces]MCX4516351.1 hypothetical protein [Streptomyces anulatus]MCX4599178.1 hypothetical protein [Streptomyces anulatus]WSU71718.1 hypothetical protein OG499_01645 [Streptomyces anulatus]WTD29917.1 hypothetical protein OH737_37680 [Streptomyces anulatus]